MIPRPRIRGATALNLHPNDAKEKLDAENTHPSVTSVKSFVYFVVKNV